MYVCMHIYIYIYVYTYTYIHTYIHTYIDIYIYKCMYTCIHTYIHTYIHMSYVRFGGFRALQFRVPSFSSASLVCNMSPGHFTEQQIGSGGLLVNVWQIGPEFLAT